MTTATRPDTRRRATSTIRITSEIYARLWRERQPGESMDTVVRRLLTLYDLQPEASPDPQMREAVPGPLPLCPDCRRVNNEAVQVLPYPRAPLRSIDDGTEIHLYPPTGDEPICRLTLSELDRLIPRYAPDPRPRGDTAPPPRPRKSRFLA